MSRVNSGAGRPASVAPPGQRLSTRPSSSIRVSVEPSGSQAATSTSKRFIEVGLMAANTTTSTSPESLRIGYPRLSPGTPVTRPI